MQDVSHKASQPKLDRSKLLGFRNLVAVTTADSNVEQSSDLAFCKRGETLPPPARQS